ncbi:hypothetical protein LTR84_005724 [Exophiala bonariae]|uniref:Uncharacterized protein n=1 Tax=Exophiala bonariae TaxID=1690606 RepID=A0AAV9N361_9EURO|nr:hypothetical protein LTR84_005724 [Exophiala bonariae]
MGIPFSKEIREALDQVEPLRKAGFEVLRTTKNISLILACIQVLTVIILALILAALFGLLLTMNPDLEDEKQMLVTPALKWISGWLLSCGGLVKWFARLVFFVVGGGFVLFLWHGSTVGAKVPDTDTEGKDDEEGKEGGDAKGKGKDKGKDKEKDNGK